MSTLVVEMKIPVQCEPVIGAPALTFTKWLPQGKANGIAMNRDGVDLVLWFDLAATHGVQADALPHQVNVPVGYVRVDATVYHVGSSRVDLQACKLEYSIVSPK